MVTILLVKTNETLGDPRTIIQRSAHHSIVPLIIKSSIQTLIISCVYNYKHNIAY